MSKENIGLALVLERSGEIWSKMGVSRVENPLVSIVIPTFNQGAYIAECLESICSQTYPTIEVIVQDSCSTDSTQSICQAFVARDPRFKYVREKDLGQSDAINRGLKLSSGKYFTWICSDDYFWKTNSIETLVKTFEAQKNSNVDGVFGRAQFVSENGQAEGEYFTLKNDLTLQDFRSVWPLAQPSSLWLREAFTREGGVNPDLHLAMDLDLFIRILKSGSRAIFVDHPIACVRNQPNAKSVVQSMETARVAYDLVVQHFGVSDPMSTVYGRQLLGIVDFPKEHTRFPWIPKFVRVFVRKYFLNPFGLLKPKKDFHIHA